MKKKITILLVLIVLILLTGSIKNTPRLIVDKTITLLAYYSFPPLIISFDDEINYMKPESFLDLDTGENGTKTSSELYYSVGCGTMCFSGTTNIRRDLSKEIGIEEPGFNECYRVLVEPGDEGFDGTSLDGYYSCYLTDEGRLSQIYIVEQSIRSGEAKIIIEVKTWDEIVVGN